MVHYCIGLSLNLRGIIPKKKQFIPLFIISWWDLEVQGKVAVIYLMLNVADMNSYSEVQFGNSIALVALTRWNKTTCSRTGPLHSAIMSAPT